MSTCTWYQPRRQVWVLEPCEAVRTGTGWEVKAVRCSGSLCPAHLVVLRQMYNRSLCSRTPSVLYLKQILPSVPVWVRWVVRVAQRHVPGVSSRSDMRCCHSQFF